MIWIRGVIARRDILCQTMNINTGTLGKSSYKDPNDYIDVENFSLENMDDFESGDDVWDNLEDEFQNPRPGRTIVRELLSSRKRRLYGSLQAS